MAKRFNPRKKTWEYNIKWENFGQYVLTFLDFKYYQINHTKYNLIYT